MKKSTELIIGYGEGISQEEDWGVYTGFGEG